MTDLVPCPDCAELLHAGSGDCPWCSRTGAAAPTRRVGNLVLVSLGLLTLAEGCTSTAIYGYVCTDSCSPSCFPTESDFSGQPTELDGTPLGLTALPTDPVTSTVAWDPCVGDDDPSAARMVLQSQAMELWSIDVGGLTVEGSGAPRLTWEDGTPDDRFLLEDGALGDGLTRTVAVDGTPVSDLVIRLEVEGAADLSAGLPYRLPLLDDSAVSRTLTLTDGGGTLTIAVDPQP